MADMMINICDAYRALSDFPHLLIPGKPRGSIKAGNENGLQKPFEARVII
jgi:hypothetical protein